MISRYPTERHNRGRAPSAGTPAFDPSSIANLQRLYLADSTPESTTPYWGDDSGGGRVPYAFSGTQVPAYATNVVNGKAGLVFAGTDIFLWQTIAEDRLFHDGTGCTLALEWKSDAAAATQAILATNNLAGVGFFLSHDGVNQRLVIQARNATTTIFSVAGANNSCLNANAHQLIVRMSSADTPDYSFWLDGALYASGNFTATPDAGNPVAALRMAFSSAGTAQWVGKMARFIVYSRGLTGDLTTGEIKALNDNFWTLASTRTNIRKIWTLGDSMVANASSWRVKLWYMAEATAAQRLDMLGSQSSGAFTLPDAAHEGYSGDTIAALDAHIAALSQPTATDVLLTIGTNDAVAEDLTNAGIRAAAQARLVTLMTNVEAKAPSATWWLITPPLSTSGTVGPRITAWNAELEAIATGRGWQFIDLMAGPNALVAGDISGDLIHPTASTAPAPPNAEAGYDKWARTVAAAIGL